MAIFSILLALMLTVYFFYRLFIINFIRRYEIQLSNFLSTKEFFIAGKKFNLDFFFQLLKLTLLLLALYAFLFASKMLFFHILKLSGFKFFLSGIIFGLSYLGFLFYVYTICLNTFHRKTVFLDEILDIYIFYYVIVFFCLIIDEIHIYPGGKQKTFNLEFPETIEVPSSSPNLNKEKEIVPTPVEE